MNRLAYRSARWRRFFRAIPTGCGVILLSLLAGQGFRSRAEDGGKETNAAGVTTVQTLEIQWQDSIETVRAFPGILKARRAVDLGFERSGRLTRLLVTAGQAVAENEPLAEMDTRRLEARRSALQAARDRAAQSLADLNPGAAAATSGNLRAAIQQLKAELAQVEANLDASLRSANSQPASLRPFQERLQSLQGRVEALNEGARQQKIDALRTRIGELEGQLSDAAIELEMSTLTAPFSGVVATCSASQGEVLSAGMPVVRLVSAEGLEAWFGVPVELAGRVEIGQTDTLTVRGRRLQAVVSAKLPEIDRATRTRTVIYSLDDTESDPSLPGEVAQVELRTDINSPGFWVPLTALMREARGLWSIYAIEGDDPDSQKVTRRYVELIYLENDRALVRGTLATGDQIISEGTHRVVPGQQVRAAKAAPAADAAAGDSP